MGASGFGADFTADNAGAGGLQSFAGTRDTGFCGRFGELEWGMGNLVDPAVSRALLRRAWFLVSIRGSGCVFGTSAEEKREYLGQLFVRGVVPRG